jgi:plasmid stabilization system protein ParE
MFGSGRRIDELGKRVLALEEMLEQRVVESVKRTEPRLEALESRLAKDPNERLEFLLNSVAEELRRRLHAAFEEVERAHALAARIAELHAALETGGRGPALTAPRSKLVLNRVYRAEWTGYVSFYFDGTGRMDRVQVLVGNEDPPTECVCESIVDSYAAAVVRKGEYWVARSPRSWNDERSSESDVKCVFTPFL